MIWVALWWPAACVSVIHSVPGCLGLKGWGCSEGRKSDQNKTAIMLTGLLSHKSYVFLEEDTNGKNSLTEVDTLFCLQIGFFFSVAKEK